MISVLEVIWHGLRDSLLMTWEIWWALVVGFAISAVVQAWVPRERIEAALSGSGLRPLAIATGLGAASSSCSYASVAIARSLFVRGASAAAALAFQLASTNLVWELGAVLWVLIGWQFTLAEYLGGIVMILVTAILVRSMVSPRLEAQARQTAEQAAAVGREHDDHQHHGLAHGCHRDIEASPLRIRIRSRAGWTEVAQNFRGDWQMLWREIAVGLLVAGFVAQLGDGFFRALFLEHTGGATALLENAAVGPLIAVLSFVCSVGNVPLAAVLWSGGVSFAGVLAFLFGDLIVLPIIAIYRKLYGGRYALRIVIAMLLAAIASAIIIDLIFSGLGLIPHGVRPSRSDLFGSIGVNYKLVLDALAFLIFGALLWLARSDDS